MEDEVNNGPEHISISLDLDMEKSLNDILLENNHLLSNSNIKLNKKLHDIFTKYNSIISKYSNDKIKLENLISENSVLIVKNTSLTKKIELTEKLLNIKETILNATKNSFFDLNNKYEAYIKLSSKEKKQNETKVKELNEKIYNLENKISSLNLEKTCKVCYKNTINTIFFPCGHITCCKECKDEIQINDNKCPLCRKEISEFANIYLP